VLRISSTIAFVGARAVIQIDRLIEEAIKSSLPTTERKQA
jgi:hypothetical protein